MRKLAANCALDALLLLIEAIAVHSHHVLDQVYSRGTRRNPRSSLQTAMDAPLIAQRADALRIASAASRARAPFDPHGGGTIVAAALHEPLRGLAEVVFPHLDTSRFEHKQLKECMESVIEGTSIACRSLIDQRLAFELPPPTLQEFLTYNEDVPLWRGKAIFAICTLEEIWEHFERHGLDPTREQFYQILEAHLVDGEFEPDVLHRFEYRVVMMSPRQAFISSLLDAHQHIVKLHTFFGSATFEDIQRWLLARPSRRYPFSQVFLELRFAFRFNALFLPQDADASKITKLFLALLNYLGEQ